MIEFEIFIAKDDRGTHFFQDKPDLVKYDPFSDIIEWVGYPANFGTFDRQIKEMLENEPHVFDLYPFDAPIHIKVKGFNIEIL